MPTGTVENLLKPENKETRTAVLTYHVVAGKLSLTDIANAIKTGNASATLTTVQGGKLQAMMSGKDVLLKDEKGNTSKISIFDVNQSNDVVHVVESVVLPK